MSTTSAQPRHRPRRDLLPRVVPHLSCDPCPENSEVCWVWLGPKYLVRGGKQHKQRVYKNGQLDNVYFIISKDRMQIAPISYNGKTDTVARQLYRYFISEPPSRTRKTCNVGQCCNPWHMEAALDYAVLRAEVLAEIQPALPPNDDLHELAEMICEHWTRQPRAMLDQIIEVFAPDYSENDVTKAARIATLEMDGCPPMIRASLDEVLGISSEDRRKSAR